MQCNTIPYVHTYICTSTKTTTGVLMNFGPARLHNASAAAWLKPWFPVDFPNPIAFAISVAVFEV